MSKIGFTTWCLYKSDIGFDEWIKLYHTLGANIIELSFATPKELLSYNFSEEIKKEIRTFEWISMHAPWKEVTYWNNPETHKIIEKLRSVASEFPIEWIVLHPDTIEDFEILTKAELPFLIENMDKRKSYGTHPEHFKELKETYDFWFVLDIQHAYEHDPTMKLAKELVEIMWNRLKHMHISGHNETEIHMPTHLASNKEAVTEILKMKLPVPKILEGILLEDIENTIINEITYIKKYEDF